MHSDVTSSVVSPALPQELQTINDLIQPFAPLSENLLQRIKAKRDSIIQNMIMATMTPGTDLTSVRALTITNEPEPVDIRAKTFVLKMFKVINDGIEEDKIGVNALRSFLNMALPCRLNMDEIKPRLNASPSDSQQIIAQYTGPNNPEKERFINAQCLKPVKNFMQTIDNESLDKILGKD